jgi:hypothetical protein
MRDSTLPEAIRAMSPQARQFAHAAIALGMSTDSPEQMAALQSTLQAQFEGKRLTSAELYQKTEVFLGARIADADVRQRVLEDMVLEGVIVSPGAGGQTAENDLLRVEVNGKRDGLGAAIGDRSLDLLGWKTGQYVEGIETRIRDNPWLGYGLEAVAFASSPLGFLGQKALAARPIGDALENLKHRVTDAVADRYVDAGYDGERAAWDGKEVMAASAMALGVLPSKVLGALGERRSLKPGHSYQLPNRQARYPEVVITPELRQQMGPRPAGMINAHEHHVLRVNGSAGAHRELVRDGQDILREYGIDPLHGVENLTWAPNKGHSLANTESLVNDLRAAKLGGLSRDDVVAILRRAGEEARNR